MWLLGRVSVSRFVRLYGLSSQGAYASGVFWVDAETTASTVHGIRAALQDAATDDATPTAIGVEQLTSVWRATLACLPRCLVVFDNVEDASTVSRFFPAEVGLVCSCPCFCERMRHYRCDHGCCFLLLLVASCCFSCWWFCLCARRFVSCAEGFDR